MLGALTIEFDQSSFIRKLRHYFTDSAPIEVDLEINADSVKVKAPTGMVECPLDSSKDIKENIHSIIAACESNLYPEVEREILVSRSLSIEEQKNFILRGLTLEEINRKSKIKEIKKFCLTRVAYPSMTIILKSLDGENDLIAQFSMPLFKVLSDLENLSPRERFYYISNNSVMKEINHEV